MEQNDEEIPFPFNDLEELTSNLTKRISCQRCDRPEHVCICFAFPETPIDIKTTVHILQHPREEDARLLTTVPLLRECIPKDRCIVYKGKRFPESQFGSLYEVCKQENTALLFPSKDAVTVEEFVKELDGKPLNLIVLDGTWREARSLNHNCKFLHEMRKVKITGTWRSEYVIRTQPTDESVSTLEAIGIALSQIENRPDIIEIARKPLKALCDFQLDHGAQKHDSKESLAAKGIKYRFFENKNKYM